MGLHAAFTIWLLEQIADSFMDGQTDQQVARIYSDFLISLMRDARSCRTGIEVFQIGASVIREAWTYTKSLAIVYDMDMYIPDSKRPEQRRRKVKRDKDLKRKYGEDGPARAALTPDSKIEWGILPDMELVMSDRSMRQLLPDKIMQWVMEERELDPDYKKMAGAKNMYIEGPLIPCGHEVLFIGARKDASKPLENMYRVARGLDGVLTQECICDWLPGMQIGEADMIIPRMIYAMKVRDPAQDNVMIISKDSDFLAIYMLHHKAYMAKGIRVRLYRTMAGSALESPEEFEKRTMQNHLLAIKEEKLKAIGVPYDQKKYKPQRPVPIRIMVDCPLMYDILAADYDIPVLITVAILMECDYVKFVHGLGAKSLLATMLEHADMLKSLLEVNEATGMYTLNTDILTQFVIAATNNRVNLNKSKTKKGKAEFIMPTTLEQVREILGDKGAVRMPETDEVIGMFKRCEWYLNYCIQTPLTGVQLDPLSRVMIGTEIYPRYGYVKSQDNMIYDYPYKPIDEDAIVRV
jgi:hypothetical protein